MSTSDGILTRRKDASVLGERPEWAACLMISSVLQGGVRDAEE